MFLHYNNMAKTSCVGRCTAPYAAASDNVLTTSIIAQVEYRRPVWLRLCLEIRKRGVRYKTEEKRIAQMLLLLLLILSSSSSSLERPCRYIL